MSDKSKRFFIALGTFFAGVFTGIIALLHYRRPASTTRKLAEDSNRTITDAHNAVRNAADTSDDLAETADDLERTAQSIRDSALNIGANQQTIDGIIESIRAQKLDENSRM